MENKTLIKIVGIVGIVILGLAFIGSRADKGIKVDFEPYENVFVDAFMEGCLEEGANIEYCTCSYKELSSRMSLDDLIAMGIRIDEGKGLTNRENKALVDSTVACLGLLKI
jgi:hypothetical protein